MAGAFRYSSYKVVDYDSTATNSLATLSTHSAASKTQGHFPHCPSTSSLYSLSCLQPNRYDSIVFPFAKEGGSPSHPVNDRKQGRFLLSERIRLSCY